jgi:endoglucanase
MHIGECGQNVYKGISTESLSFDLLNEPCAPKDMNDQYSEKPPVDGEIYRKVAKGCLDVILKENDKRIVVADGNGGGSLVTPELTDLPLAQSCRGYYPHLYFTLSSILGMEKSG